MIYTLDLLNLVHYVKIAETTETELGLLGGVALSFPFLVAASVHGPEGDPPLVSGCTLLLSPEHLVAFAVDAPG